MARVLDDKIKAAGAIAATGNQKKAAELTGIPRETIRDWLNGGDDDFHRFLQAARDEYEAHLSDRYAHYMDLALEQFEKEIKNASAGTAAKCAGIFFDKRALVLSRPTSISGKPGDIEKRLDEIGRMLEERARPAIRQVK